MFQNQRNTSVKHLLASHVWDDRLIYQGWRTAADSHKKLGKLPIKDLQTLILQPDQTGFKGPINLLKTFDKSLTFPVFSSRKTFPNHCNIDITVSHGWLVNVPCTYISKFCISWSYFTYLVLS